MSTASNALHQARHVSLDMPTSQQLKYFKLDDRLNEINQQQSTHLSSASSSTFITATTDDQTQQTGRKTQTSVLLQFLNSMHKQFDRFKLKLSNSASNVDCATTSFLSTDSSSSFNNNYVTNQQENNSNGEQRRSMPFMSLFHLLRQSIVMRRVRLLRLALYLLACSMIIFAIWRPVSIILQNKQNNVQNEEHTRPQNEADRQTMEIQHKLQQQSSRSQPNLDLNKNRINKHSFTLSSPIYLSAQDFYSIKDTNAMQGRIREAAKFSWDSYKRYAWGHDMLRPRSRQPEAWFDLGLTIVDSVDTLIMMGLVDDANSALDWIETKLTFDVPNENSNCFELTIRILAGLLSAYHLTMREKIKLQAIDLGNRILHCYDTKIKVIPYSDINLLTKQAHSPPWTQHSSLSEVASLQLEFRYLTQVSGDQKFEETTFRTSEHIHNKTLERKHKLLPMYIDTNTGQFEETIITLGARTDSYYEYLLKQYLQTGTKWLETDYLDAVDEMRKLLILNTNGAQNYTFVSELQLYKTVNGTEDPKYQLQMDHLVCFLPGTLALGYYHFSPKASEHRQRYNLNVTSDKLNSRYDSHIDLAEKLSRTCYHMYSEMGTGLAAEIATFSLKQTSNSSEEDNLKNSTSDRRTLGNSSSSNVASTSPELFVRSTAAHNILRPEFVETLFYMYHITGREIYKQQAEKVFDAFHKYSRVASGFSPISDVRREPPVGADLNEWLYRSAPERMESFWISETLKYLYLTFCEDERVIGRLLNNYVFNTEAHILPILKNRSD